jgi:hypothetical protein
LQLTVGGALKRIPQVLKMGTKNAPYVLGELGVVLETEKRDCECLLM